MIQDYLIFAPQAGKDEHHSYLTPLRKLAAEAKKTTTKVWKATHFQKKALILSETRLTFQKVDELLQKLGGKPEELANFSKSWRIFWKVRRGTVRVGEHFQKLGASSGK